MNKQRFIDALVMLRLVSEQELKEGFEQLRDPGTSIDISCDLGHICISRHEDNEYEVDIYMKARIESPFDAIMRIGGLGSCSSGLKDLSSNPKHMEGFGRD